MTKDEVLEDMTYLFIYSFIKKLTIDKDGNSCAMHEVTQLPLVYDDLMLKRQGRIGIYGFCSVSKDSQENHDFGNEIGSAVDWKISQCSLSEHELVKFCGVVEYKLKEIINKRMKFDLDDDKLTQLQDKYEQECKYIAY